MKRLKQPQRGQADPKLVILIILGLFAAYAFFLTWPVSLALSIAFIVWLLTRERRSEILKGIHGAAFPVLIGISLFWIIVLWVKVKLESSPFGSPELFATEQSLLSARRAVHAVTGPNLTVYLLLLAIVLVLLVFFPKFHLISQLIRAKKQLARVHLCLLAMTSFTFFGSQAADELAKADYENRLRDFQVSLRTELEPAEKFLATKLANETVNEQLKRPIPEPTKTRLVHLIETFGHPTYIQVPDLSKYPENLSPKEMLEWEFNHPPAARSKLVAIDGTFVMHEFIRDFANELQAQVVAQSGVLKERDLESVARQSFGSIAESDEDQQRQEKLIEDEKTLASQSNAQAEVYKEASSGVGEAVVATFSEALGVLTPNMRELARDWIKELVEEAITPFIERNIERHEESVLRWSRKNLTGSRLQDVPEELRQEIRSSSGSVREFIVPGFLVEKGSRAASDARGHAAIPEEISQEILRRQEQARKEIEQRDAQPPGSQTTTFGERERKIEEFPERERLLPERGLRENPRLP